MYEWGYDYEIIWRRGYDEGFKNAKTMFAPIETLLAAGVQ